MNAGTNNYVNPNAGSNVSGNIGFSKPLNVLNGNDANANTPSRNTDSAPAHNFDGGRNYFGSRPL